MLASLGIALTFWLVGSGIASLRERIVRHRPGQYVHEDVTSRVAFAYVNPILVAEIQQRAREAAPRVYRAVAQPFAEVERQLLGLPEAVSMRLPQQLPKTITDNLDGGTITVLKRVHLEYPDDYKRWVRHYVGLLEQAAAAGKLVVLPHDERESDVEVKERHTAKVQVAANVSDFTRLDLARTYSNKPSEEQRAELLSLVKSLADMSFSVVPTANIAGYTIAMIEPTHRLDEQLTLVDRQEAERTASLEQATQNFREKSLLVPKRSSVTEAAHRLLAEEQRAYVASMPLAQRLQGHAGMAGIVLVLTVAMCVYVGTYQPRIVANRVRGAAIAALLLSMLLVAQVAALGTMPLLVFGVAPTLLVAMILTIAYDQRFALGIATLHAILVTAALDQTSEFFLVVWVGVTTSCFLLDDVRTRSKLVEVGGLTALAMMAVAAALGAMLLEPWQVIWRNALYVGAAGIGVGFVVLGILPFLEKVFKMTTSMTLLELADASHPLLRRLQVEAPGTYNHSLQVATLAESAAEAIGADSLLCRVGGYYHDVGKIHKAEYFCENQFDGRNRHINLTPNVSLLIIVAHVKDGVELAREYKLPKVLLPFIQQHHGTTLVEYFYHQACQRDGEEGPGVSDTQFRYPGPKPRSRETAILMCADAVESATRAMTDPNPSRIETLVHELVMRRLLDGQFDESDMTFAELELVEKSLAKTLLGIYHGRLAYPSTAATQQGSATTPATASPAARTA
jgi:cyclic-di-AMP phosphodiesterase PgpH